MSFYHKLGELPRKRHTQFRKPDGSLYREEVMGLEGFSGIQSILYHHFLPPRVVAVEDLGPARPEFVEYGPIRHRAFATAIIAAALTLTATPVLSGIGGAIADISIPAMLVVTLVMNLRPYDSAAAAVGWRGEGMTLGAVLPATS